MSPETKVVPLLFQITIAPNEEIEVNKNVIKANARMYIKGKFNLDHNQYSNQEHY